ncbi:hypothetical protein RRG08_025114 [Elysia crispata]|uniref:Uncharacterized protein n=1 Tax=Elysia crispata TaxID=231223 RepID=A0AAE1AI74_9GAST|nr:hypothetical protein RRG08_025114 [Elysia crispata]
MDERDRKRTERTWSLPVGQPPHTRGYIITTALTLDIAAHILPVFLVVPTDSIYLCFNLCALSSVLHGIFVGIAATGKKKICQTSRHLGESATPDIVRPALLISRWSAPVTVVRLSARSISLSDDPSRASQSGPDQATAAYHTPRPGGSSHLVSLMGEQAHPPVALVVVGGCVQLLSALARDRDEDKTSACRSWADP